MRLTDQFRMKLLLLFRRGRAGTRLDHELRFHLDAQIEENVAAGMGPEEARAAAMRSFGNPALLREQTRATWSWNWLESLFRDLRIGARTLGRTPGFAAIAILVMALGIGANVALFAVVHSVLLKPLPYRDPGRLVSVYENESKGNHRTTFLPIDAGSFFLWQSAAQGVAELGLISPWQEYNVSAEGGKLPEKIDAAWCSWNLFSTLGVRPALGRDFSASDDSAGSPATVILTDPFWKRRYSGDHSIIGKTIWLNSKPYTVIGVLPPTFTYVSSFGGNTLQAWTPVRHEAPPALLRDYGDHDFLAVARLLGDTTLEGLRSRLDSLQKHIQTSHTAPTIHDSVTARTMLDDAVHNYKTPLCALLASTGCILLIACMNVASLLVARAAARSREMAIRTALGGGRFRLLRERLTESLLLSLISGAFGLMPAWAGLQWLVHARRDMHRVESISIDGVVLLFAVGATVVCALLSGFIAAVGVPRANLAAILQGSMRSQAGSQARAGLRKTLLVVQVSLTVVLLVGAGLLVKSYQRLRATDLGVPTDNVLTMYLTLPEARYKEPVQQVAFFESLIGRVRTLPGVQSAGLVSIAPGEGWGGDHLMRVAEHPQRSTGDGVDLMVRGADPGYFAAIGISLLRGRIFTSDERLERAHVAVISQLAARQLFPGEDPIGKHLVDTYNRQTTEVIGVVGDTRWYVSEDTMPMLYWPIYGNDYSIATIVIRSTQDVNALALPVQKVVGQLDPDLPVSNVLTLSQAVGQSTIDSQFDAMLVVGFALIALVLAAAGLYGVLAYLVAQRVGEIGIRIALGAQRSAVLRLVLSDGIWPALFGLVLGLAGSIEAAQLIRTMLYETRPLDPLVFTAVATILLVVATFACLVPAWRASRLDPMQALRTE